MSSDKEVGARIRRLREEKGWSQLELAQRVGYSGRSAIWNIENGSHAVRTPKLMEIADALDTSAAYLLGWMDDDPAEEARKDAELLTKFHSLTPGNQRTILTMIDALIGQQKEDD